MSLRHWRWEPAIALLLPLVGILPSILPGVIDGADSVFHVHRIHAMRLLFDHGEFYPRWVSYFHLGYGYPIFNFYAPGSYYLGAFLTYLGFDAAGAYNLLSAAAWMFGSLGCYGLARRYLPAYPALLAALLWSYAPSRLFEVWEQGSLPQTMAAACLPWLFLAIVDAARRRSLLAVPRVALPFAAILFLHQPTSVIASLFAGLLAIVLVISALRSGWRDGIFTERILGAGGLLGIGLAAIFVFPALLELQHIDAARGTVDMWDVLKSSFLPPDQLFVQQGPFDLADLRRDLPKTLGLVGGATALTGMVALVRRRKAALAALLVAAVALVAFMLLPVSLPVWETIPLLGQLRFPERFLRVGAIPLALLGGASLLLMPARKHGAAFLIVGAVVLASAFPSVIPTEKFLNWDSISAVDEIRMEADEFIWGSTSYNEFNPIWGERISLDAPEGLEEYRAVPFRIPVQRFACPDGQYEVLGDARYRFLVAEMCTVAFRQYYYPGWVVLIDGVEYAATPEPDLGLIQVELAPGEHDVSLRYAGTPTQALGAWLSLFSASLALALLAVGSRAIGAEQVNIEEQEIGYRTGVAAVLLCVAIAVWVNSWVIPQSTLFRQQSAPDAPAAMTTRLDVDFGGVITLLGYRLDASSLSRYGRADIELFWRAQHLITDNYRPIVQLVDTELTTAYAVSQPFRPAAGHTTGWTPDRFASDPHRLEIFDFVLNGMALISVQMVQSETGVPLLLPDGSDRLLLAESLVVIRD